MTDDGEPVEEPFSIPVNEDGTLKFYVDMPEEEFQAIVDYFATLPIVPGEMPLEWWFAVCGKLEELRIYLTMKLEEELKKLEEEAAASEETLPDETQTEETQPEEPLPEETLPTELVETEITEPVEPTEAQPSEPQAEAPTEDNTEQETTEITDLPTEAETPAEPGASVLNEEVALSQQSLVLMSWNEVLTEEENIEEDETIIASSEEESPLLAGEEASVAAVGAEGASEEESNKGGVSLLAESPIQIDSALALVTFSYVNDDEYNNTYTISIAPQDGGVREFDLTGNFTVNDQNTPFLGLANKNASNPFKGIIKSTDGQPVALYLDRALFVYLSTEATIDSNIQLVSKMTDITNKNLLADNLVGTNETAKDLTVTVGQLDGGDTTYYTPSLIGTMQGNAKVNLSVNVPDGLRVKSTGFLCANITGDARLTTFLDKFPTNFIPSSSPAGLLVGTMSVNAQFNYTPKGAATISSTLGDTATDNNIFGCLVGQMEGNSHLTVSSSSITINLDNKKGNTGGLVGKLDGATLEVNAPILIELVKGKEMAGGLVAEAIDPTFSFGTSVTISGTGTNPLITKYNIGGPSGGIAGKLTVKEDLTLSGTANEEPGKRSLVEVENISIAHGDVGGLFGEVHNLSLIHI